jgi:L-glyceraldehyde 3-phosphate reductase
MTYSPLSERYDNMIYRRCGRSGLKLPVISLGLWLNFGDIDDFENSRLMLQRAFDLGICHFDLANNYGPPPGAAEENFGKILKKDFAGHRDELTISTKAGWEMWPGPYGDFGSRKYLIASLDQSLNRLGLDYVDIFYHHRPDPVTPLEETMQALDHIVRTGRALYIGISQYKPDDTKKAIEILSDLGTPLLIHQPRYNILDRWIEPELLGLIEEEGIGCIVYSPLAQGILTDRYLSDIPDDARVNKNIPFLTHNDISPEKMETVRKLNEIAANRGQTLAQMSIAWVLRKKAVTSALIGASKVQQIEDVAGCLENLEFFENELQEIDNILKEQNL